MLYTDMGQLQKVAEHLRKILEIIQPIKMHTNSWKRIEKE